MPIMKSFAYIFACVSAILLLGCTETVDPNLGTDRPYTLWGLINPKADTHAVRIFEIKENIELVRPEPLDATVTSFHVQSGQERVWKDSLVQLADGDYRHVYWAAFSAKEGDTFRLTVRRSDGATSSALTTVPPPISLEVLPPDSTKVFDVILPVMIQGVPPALPRVDVEYDVESVTPDGVFLAAEPVTVSYDGRAMPEDRGWLLEIDLRDDFDTISAVYEERDLPLDLLKLRGMELRVHVGDENWVSPVGFFDEDFLVEPGILSNVQNGFGFFGSGYLETTSWIPPKLLQGRAGFFIGGN